jgi:malate dehydrogenase (quinone)
MIENSECDVLLIGGGVMSATLGVFLKELERDLKLEIVERLEDVAQESSHARNNAGTGHAGLCELNYTSPMGGGGIDCKKAVKVMECYEVSKQFWAWLVGHGASRDFIHPVPHMSYVTGEEDVAFLRGRFEALHDCQLFRRMKFSAHRADLDEWMPLMMAGRDPDEKLAATWSPLGTDVDFGRLTRALFRHLFRHHGVGVQLGQEVLSLRRDHGWWVAKLEDCLGGDHREIRARFVFIGAGGGALRLLEKSDIPEGEKYAGFPVSGQWLVCKNPELAARHHAKVYGKAKVGAPPMSVPHLDSRWIDGNKELLFGPFAGFSTKFLKEGSYLDLPMSITADNILPLISAGIHNLPLTRYLISQVTQTFEDKLAALREFLPGAREDDWELAIAGQRVQVIKRTEDGGGSIEFGTEIVSAVDNSLAALLGASPGASTSVSIVLDLLADCFPEKLQTVAWQKKLLHMIPSYGRRLASHPALAAHVRAWSHDLLGLPLFVQ